MMIVSTMTYFCEGKITHSCDGIPRGLIGIMSKDVLIFVGSCSKQMHISTILCNISSYFARRNQIAGPSIGRISSIIGMELYVSSTMSHFINQVVNGCSTICSFCLVTIIRTAVIVSTTMCCWTYV